MSDILSVIKVSFPKNFTSTLENEITDELAIAQTKWKLSLTKAQEDVVRAAAKEQLCSKVSSLFKNNWKFESNMTISVAGLTEDLFLSKKNKLDEDLKFLLSKSGWSLTTEETGNSVSGDQLYSALVKTLTVWLRTAVFYGVGSFVSR